MNSRDKDFTVHLVVFIAVVVLFLFSAKSCVDYMIELGHEMTTQEQ